MQQPNTSLTANLVGQKIGPYHLISRLGENEFFTVYKAYYRDGYDYVAVKILNNSLFTLDNFTDRFQNLPKTLAKLNHLAICQLYDRGIQDDIFYIVSEFIDGVTLEAELEARRQQQQPFSLSEVAYILQTIGLAINHAHSLNYTHSHINPGNIIFTLDGIPVLVDMEIVYLVGSTALQTLSQKALPEVSTTLTVNKQADIVAMGWILYQLVNGKVSTAPYTNGSIKFSETTQTHFPAQTLKSLEAIIRKAVEIVPNNQFKHAIEMVEALQALIPPEEPALDHITCLAQTRLVKQIAVAADTTGQFKAQPGVCPYQGLFAFNEENASFFFGRETFVDQLVNVVQQKPIVMVTGPSGSGKSSVVYAGLVPYLHQSGEWEIAELRPGTQPVQALAAAISPFLVVDITETERGQKNYQLAKELTNQQTLLSELVAQILQSDSTARQMLLVIDQFEELYTLCRDETIRHKFLDMLLEATSAPVYQRKLTIVLTLRVDFLGQVLTHRAFADKLYQADIKLGPMNRNELARAIENPAVRQGVTFEEGLVERILHDVGHEPGTLPLLQFALTQLWNEQKGGQLTHKVYEAINGVTGALARYADQVYQALDNSEQLQARRVFMQLVRPGEGTEDTRRLAYRSELDDADWELAQRLVDARLMVAGRTPDHQETVEVVHEALIWEWQILRNWINEDRAFRTWQERLRTALRQWETSNYDDGAVLRGALLVEAEGWFAERQADLSQVEQNYIQASISLRKQREAEQLEAQQAKERSRRFITASLALGLVIAVILAVFAWQQWQQAKKQQLIALSNQLAAQALSRLDSQEYDLAQLLSLEANRLVDSIESRSALLVSLQRSPYRHILRHYKNPVMAAILSPNSRLLATLEEDGTIELTDTNTGYVINQLPRKYIGKTKTIAFGPNNQTIASGDNEGRIIIWDISDPHNPQVLHNFEQTGSVEKVVFSPDGQTLAAGEHDGQIILWDIPTGAPKGEPLTGHTGEVKSLAFSPNGRWLVSGSVDNAWAAIDETVLLWDLKEPVPQSYPLIGLKDNVNDITFSADGRTVAASSTNGDILLWNVGTREPVSEPLRHTSGEQSTSVTLPEIKIALSPDYRTLASGGVDGDIILWDLETGRPRREPLPTHAGTVNHLEFSRDGHTLVSANNDGAAILWAIDQQLGDSVPDLEQRVLSLTFNPASEEPQLITGSEDGEIIFWDIADRQPTDKFFEGHTLNVNTVAVSPVNKNSTEPRILATGGDDKMVHLWNLTTGKLLAEPLAGHTDGVLDVTFSPNGQILASSSQDNTIILWDVATLQPLGAPLTGHTDDVWEVAFSSDGKILASASWDGTVILWDVATKKPIGSPLVGHQGAVVSVAASPDAQIIASAGRDGSIILWDLTTGQPISSPLQGIPGTVWQVAFSPNGEILASAGCAQLTVHGNCEQGEIRLWDTKTGRQIGQSFVGHQDVAWAIAFSPNGNQLASSSRDGTIIVWDLNQQSWIRRACDFANRNLSKAEWQQYLGDELYRETCVFGNTVTS